MGDWTAHKVVLELLKRIWIAALLDRLRNAGPGAIAFWSLVSLGGFLLPILLAVALAIDTAGLGPRRVDDLLERFARQGYDLQNVKTGEIPAPRVYLKRLPRDWRRLAQADERKRAFVMILLPLVLRENVRIQKDKEHLLKLRTRIKKGDRLTHRDRVWLSRLAISYGVEPKEIKELTLRVDNIPVSLAIAQAAIESGWGTSRFATEGNALFGEWTGKGRRAMVPTGRDAGETHAIRRFRKLSESIESYMNNLNSHRAYRGFREQRAKLRRQGRPLDGSSLAKELTAYSSQGADYVRSIVNIIAKNALAALDGAR